MIYKRMLIRDVHACQLARYRYSHTRIRSNQNIIYKIIECEREGELY